MATRQTRSLARIMMAPSVIVPVESWINPSALVMSSCVGLQFVGPVRDWTVAAAAIGGLCFLR